MSVAMAPDGCARLSVVTSPQAPADIDAILGEYDELQSFLLSDLRRIVALDVGGNFAVAALVAVACDALSKLQRRRDHEVFAEMLPLEWRPVSKSLYDALRNGLAHRYTMKTIVLRRRQIGLGISWRQVEHLTFRDG